MLFDPKSSTTWAADGTHQLDIVSAGAGPIQALFGNDTLGLGLQGTGGPVLPSQFIATYTADEPYFGYLGLNPAATNLSVTDQGHPSLLTSMKQQSLIPSLSFGYTAGAQYRLRQVLGSLTLGGYDKSLFTPSSLDIDFTGDDLAMALQVNVQAIASKDQQGKTNALLPTPTIARVDSTEPMIWLPTAACEAFEKAFGLTFDPKTGLYLVDDDLHASLEQLNASITFTLANKLSGGHTSDIILPYNSFDLHLTPPYPGIEQSQRYFPLRRSANDSQNTLGRTFLQESYLKVDYERRTFSLSQSIFSENSKSVLVPITSPTASTGLSTGVKVGIAIAVVVGGVLLGTLAAFFFIRRRRARRRAAAEAAKSGLNPNEEPIRQGLAKGEMGAGIENSRFEMQGSDGNALKPYGGRTPPWVEEKSRYPEAGYAEVDGEEPRAELGGRPGAPGPGFYGGRGLHEMYDPSSILPVELPGAGLRGEMEGSTPSSSPGVVHSSSRPPRSSFFKRGSGSAGGSRPSSSSRPSPLGRHDSPPSSSSLFGPFSRRGDAAKGQQRSSDSSAPSPRSPPSSSSRGPSSPAGAVRPNGFEMVSPPPAARGSERRSDHVFSPISRQGTAPTAGSDGDAIMSPISPADEEDWRTGFAPFRGRRE